MVNAQVPTVSWCTLLQVIMRSFWLQSCWNFQGMQNLGFGFAILPVIKTLYLAKQEQSRALKRHIEFFNTHPYCAAIILGVVIQMEEAGLKSATLDPDQISRIKSGMMGPLAALGDTVFWANLKPTLALCAVALVLTAQPGQANQLSIGLWLFLILYTVPHLILRVGGVFLGYNRGINIVQDLRKFNPQLIARKLTVFLAVTTGGILMIYPLNMVETSAVSMITKSLFFFLLTALMVVAIRKCITISRLIYGLIILSILVAMTGWIN